MAQLPGSDAQTKFVSLRDGQIIAAHVRIAHPHAPWVVFSNSIATDYTIWDAQAAALSPEWNVLRYDQRGHGMSTLTFEPIDFVRLGSDVIELFDEFGVESAFYVGLSMGVPTGLAAVAAAPSRFKGLFLADGQACTAPEGGQLWNERIEYVREHGLAEFARSTATRWLADPAGSFYQSLESMIARTPVEGFTACASALADFDLVAGLSDIRCPALLVAGEHDGKLPETMRSMAELIPHARFETISDAGHVPCYEQPKAFNARMLAFLETLR